MVSKNLFLLLIALIALERLWELRKSQNNCRLLIKKGGRESGQDHFLAMVMLHSLWLVCAPLEVFWLDRAFSWPIFSWALPIFMLGQILRFLAMNELKERWTARIITINGLSPVTSGIYRYLRHPNYLGVILEIIALPLIHDAYLTAGVFTILNLWLLKIRITAEEKALQKDNNYREAFSRPV